MQLGEVQTEISDLQLVLNVGAVRVFDLDCRVKNTINRLSFCRRLDVRISGLADDIINFTKRTMGNSWEGGLTVEGEVTVHLPGSAKICRSLNQHGRWTKSLKSHDEMSKVKLCLQIQLKVNIRLSILRLPPGLLAVWFEGGDDILNAVTHGVGIRIIRSP